MLRPHPCSNCVHFYCPRRAMYLCIAFPFGIPEDILRYRVKHDKPYPGDGGIIFEQKPAPPPLTPEEEADFEEYWIDEMLWEDPALAKRLGVENPPDPGGRNPNPRHRYG